MPHFVVTHFMVPPNGPLLPHNGDVMQCSVAKSMVDCEHLPWLEAHVVVNTVIGFDYSPALPLGLTHRDIRKRAVGLIHSCYSILCTA